MKRATVLIVDDEVANIEILSAALEEDHEICFATSGEEALEIAAAVSPDLILLDVLMPGLDGYEVCRRIKAHSVLADVPVMFTTALGDTSAESRGLDVGAIDYITKPISPVIVRARVRNHLEMKYMRDQLAELAVTDALTGLGNRRRLEGALQLETAQLSRTGADLSVIILDIDFFKQFNDAYGHPAGDQCIAMIGAALKRAVRRAADVAARYGGEEFACVLPNASLDQALAVAHAIRGNVRALGIPHDRSTAAAFVTVSIGVATAPCVIGANPNDWITAADSQLYLAKRSGRDSIRGQRFDPVSLNADGSARMVNARG